MDDMNIETTELNVDELEFQGESDIETNLTNNKKVVSSDYSTDDYGTMAGYDDSMYYGNDMTDNNSGVNTHVILYIVIAVCAVLGIALGIFAGKKAAYK